MIELQTGLKQYAPDLRSRGHKNMTMGQIFHMITFPSNKQSIAKHTTL